MLREFNFFRGYIDNLPIEIDWNNINRINDINRLTVTPGYGTITIPNYYPNYFIGDYPLTGTITTTPNYLGTGYVTIPRISSGTATTTTGFSLTTSNTNGTTYTTGGMGGTLTTGTATYSSSSFKLQ